MKRTVSIILALASALLLFLVFKNPAAFRNIDSMGGDLVDVTGRYAWRPIIQYDSNGYFSWRADPWIDHLSGFLTIAANSIRYHLALLTVFWCGACLLFKISLQAATANAITFASILAASVGFIFGADTVVLSTICWTPLLILVLDCGRRNGDFSWLVVFALFSLRTVTTANHTLFLTFAAAFTIAAALAKSEIADAHRASRVSLGARNRRIVHRGCVLLACGAYILFLSTAQYASFPSYPQGARLIPLDGVPGIARPLVGADTPIPVINVSAVKATVLRPAVILVLLSGIFFLYRRKQSLSSMQLFAGAVCAAAAVLWDCAATKSITIIGPLEAIARMFPNCFLVPIAPIALAIALLFFACAVVSEFGRLRWISSLVGLLIFAFAFVEITTARKLNAAPAGTRTEDFSPPAWPHGSGSNSIREAFLWQQALTGPSRFTARFFGRAAMAFQEEDDFAPAVPLKNFFRRAWASANPGAAPLLADGELDTRYTTLSGSQRGGETILVWLNNPVTIVGVELRVGKYLTDFPRGIVVSGGTDCSEDPEKTAAQSPPLANFPNWQGPLLTTSAGLPYFGGQSDVRIPFNRPIEVQCLRIVQSGKNDQFDWSIAEIGLFMRHLPSF